MDCKPEQVALVTGGASGIGFGMATAFAKAGMKIALADIEVDAVNTAADLLRADGADVISVVVDVSDREALAHARDEVLGAFGAIHLVCNNAGVNRPGPIQDLSYDDWD